MRSIDINDPGLLDPVHTGLLIDAYELTMAASYLRRGMNERATFELFVRRLPPRRDWLMVAGVGPALELVSAMRFDQDGLRYLRERGFQAEFLEYLGDFQFTGDIDAMPEGTVVFANEPVMRVTAPRIEAQLLETILLNQLNFQIAIATKAARIVLAIGAGLPGQGGRLVDFSPRRDHGIDAAMKAARAAAVAGRWQCATWQPSDLVRNVFVVAVMFGVGLLVGFNPQGGASEIIGAIALLLLMSFAFSWIGATIGLAVRNVEAVQSAGFIWLFALTFASSAFVPTSTMPAGLRAFAVNQPVTKIINAVRDRLLGEPVGSTAWIATIWCVGIVVFVRLAMRAYRRAGANS
jgi:hypothetical protein